MRPPMIVVVAPCVDGLACFGEGEEHVLVEALIAQFAVEALDEGILHRLAGFDVVPVKAGRKVHQWARVGLASGRGSARGNSPSLVHGTPSSRAAIRESQSYPGSEAVDRH